MEFRVLGPLEVVVDGRVVPIGSSRLRCLLAMLLVRANRFVGFDELVEAIWGDSVPANPRPAVYTCVTRLRTITGATIEAGADGYRIAVNEAHVDLKRFEAAVLTARAADEREAEVLQEALALWRGEPFVDVPSDYLHRTVVPALAERRLHVLERKLELDVRAGRHDIALPELQELTAAYPLRERLWASLVLALYGSGRQADALETYATVRQRLVDELGVEPGVVLRQAHQTVLAGDKQSDWQVECQLPIDIGDFTNRDDELDQVLESLRPSATVPILTISGPPGMGKSALVVRAAHRLIPHYPDGQWFLRLNGASEAPRSAAELLAELLRTVGVAPAAIPDGVDARSALLRSRLADRKVLLVLDDAGSVDQVAPLLPGRPGSAVVVTSRSELAGLSVLYGGNRLSLQPLSPHHARDLVARIAGAKRCDQDEAAATELTSLCGRMPLALRIAAANLASRPGMQISRYAEDLRTGDRLAKLRTHGESGLAVRAAFDISFATLSPADRRAFSLLGVIPGNDFSASAASALVCCTMDETVEMLDRLVAANLLECHHADRFRFHDLIRVYAADRSREYDHVDAFRRLADWYLHSIHAAVTRCLASLYISSLGPVPNDVTPLVFAADDEALRWLEVERTNYLAIIDYAAVHGPQRYTWQLTDAARPDLHHRYWTAELEHAATLGLSCAREAGARRGEAMMLLALAALKSITARFDESVEDFAECRRIAVELGETGINATAVISLAGMYSESSRPHEAMLAAEEGLALVERGAEQGGGRKIAALLQLGSTCLQLGQLHRSRDVCHQAMELVRDSGPIMASLAAHWILGESYRETGDYDDGIVHLSAVLDSEMSHHIVYDECNTAIASVYLDKGDFTSALRHAEVAIERSADSGPRKYEAQARIIRGEVHRSAGRLDLALTEYRLAHDVAVKIESPAMGIQSAIGIASVSGDAGFADHAIALARKQGMRLLEAKALIASAQVRLDLGQIVEARAGADQALVMYREFGARPGEEKAVALLARLSEKD
ncbi:AfsR/SARP family transcriptional regulator [Kibdelosporangium aridum]|uniref:DNA-binding transcriptional activator of the SARP family n=1 Tax=Kibdelosporangium aridum TaxID=2030 RepID=A0A1W2FVX6_KIBAR|nr:BTAD domain-containing putative transcriptional regulator [Kibdelosporangium aridum]SMD26109.1 DNA-binding transcriptional activator of the SARP family [Kibdelosporangium aridum]